MEYHNAMPLREAEKNCFFRALGNTALNCSLSGLIVALRIAEGYVVALARVLNPIFGLLRRLTFKMTRPGPPFLGLRNPEAERALESLKKP